MQVNIIASSLLYKWIPSVYTVTCDSQPYAGLSITETEVWCTIRKSIVSEGVLLLLTAAILNYTLWA